jgi:TM2 domain-containing membrane protein YozV
MNTQHKNKTIAALLALIGGTLGLHRFYLKGCRDKWAWLHAISVPIALLIYSFTQDVHPFFTAIPVLISMLIGFLVCLVIGTTPDEKWDVQYNSTSAQKTSTSWLIVPILVVALGIGASALIAVIARTFDLLFTGGLYG